MTKEEITKRADDIEKMFELPISIKTTLSSGESYDHVHTTPAFVRTNCAIIAQQMVVDAGIKMFSKLHDIDAKITKPDLAENIAVLDELKSRVK